MRFLLLCFAVFATFGVHVSGAQVADDPTSVARDDGAEASAEEKATTTKPSIGQIIRKAFALGQSQKVADDEFERLTERIRAGSHDEFERLTERIRAGSDDEFERLTDRVRAGSDDEFERLTDRIRAGSDDEFERLTDRIRAAAVVDKNDDAEASAEEKATTTNPSIGQIIRKAFALGQSQKIESSFELEERMADREQAAAHSTLPDCDELANEVSQGGHGSSDPRALRNRRSGRKRGPGGSRAGCVNPPRPPKRNNAGERSGAAQGGHHSSSGGSDERGESSVRLAAGGNAPSLGMLSQAAQTHSDARVFEEPPVEMEEVQRLWAVNHDGRPSKAEKHIKQCGQPYHRMAELGATIPNTCLVRAWMIFLRNFACLHEDIKACRNNKPVNCSTPEVEMMDDILSNPGPDSIPTFYRKHNLKEGARQLDLPVVVKSLFEMTRFDAHDDNTINSLGDKLSLRMRHHIQGDEQNYLFTYIPLIVLIDRQPPITDFTKENSLVESISGNEWTDQYYPTKISKHFASYLTRPANKTEAYYNNRQLFLSVKSATDGREPYTIPGYVTRLTYRFDVSSRPIPQRKLPVKFTNNNRVFSLQELIVVGPRMRHCQNYILKWTAKDEYDCVKLDFLEKPVFLDDKTPCTQNHVLIAGYAARDLDN